MIQSNIQSHGDSLSQQFSQSLMQMEKSLSSGDSDQLSSDLELLRETMVGNQYQEMFASLKSLITGVLKQNDYEQCQSEINNLLRSLQGKHSSWQKLSSDLNMMRGKIGEADMEMFEECVVQAKMIN